MRNTRLRSFTTARSMPFRRTPQRRQSRLEQARPLRVHSSAAVFAQHGDVTVKRCESTELSDVLRRVTAQVLLARVPVHHDAKIFLAALIGHGARGADRDREVVAVPVVETVIEVEGDQAAVLLPIRIPAPEVAVDDSIVLARRGPIEHPVDEFLVLPPDNTV